MFGADCPLAKPELREEEMGNTGTGFGGSGGVKLGQVKEVVIPGGYYVPIENVEGTAVEISKWLGDRMDIYRNNGERLDKECSQRSTLEKQILGKQWIKTMKEWM